MTARFQRGDLVQLAYEYEVQGNPSLFRIREVRCGQVRLGQLSPDHDDYLGVDTTIDLDDPDLIAPRPEILAQFARHVRS